MGKDERAGVGAGAEAGSASGVQIISEIINKYFFATFQWRGWVLLIFPLISLLIKRDRGKGERLREREFALHILQHWGEMKKGQGIRTRTVSTAASKDDELEKKEASVGICERVDFRIGEEKRRKCRTDNERNVVRSENINKYSDSRIVYVECKRERERESEDKGEGGSYRCVRVESPISCESD